MKNVKLISKIALITSKNINFKTQIINILNVIGDAKGISQISIFIEKNTELKSDIIWNSKKNCCKKLNLSKILMKNIHQLEDWKEYKFNNSLVYPIYIDKKIKGFIQFDKCKIRKKWKKEEIECLRTVSNIIANTYEKYYILEKKDQMKKNLEEFFNSIDEIFIIGDFNQNIIYTNKAVEEKLGYTKKELNKMKLFELNPKYLKQEAIETLNDMLNGKIENCSLAFQTKDERIILVEIKIWIGEWNNKKSIFGICKDLTKELELLEKFKKVFNNNPNIMAISSIGDKTFIDVNKAFVEKLGYSYEEIIGKTSYELNLIANQKEMEKSLEKFKKDGKLYNYELDINCKNGDIINGLFSVQLIRNQDKKYFLTVVVDVTKQKELNDLYLEEKTRLNSVIKGSNLGTWEWDIQTNKILVNDKWAEITGYTIEELEPIRLETWENLVYSDDLPKCKERIEDHFKGEKEFYEIEHRIKHKDGRLIWVHDRGSIIEWDEKGKPLMMYGTHVDITKEKENEIKIKENSIRDPLTNIYNRRYIYERMKELVELYKIGEIMFSVAILDIDFFKRINDTYGHIAGDYILKEFTKVIANNLREYDLLGRYGGEEFIVIIQNLNSKEAKEIIERILEIIRQKVFVYKNDNINFTCSTGISDVSEVELETIKNESIISIADKRLYEAKNSGRNKIVY